MKKEDIEKALEVLKKALELCEESEGNKPIKKYEFTGETINHHGITLHRIRRLSDGLVGGFIEKEGNLSHDGVCFVFDDAKVYEDAWIFEDAMVSDAVICGNALVSGKAIVYDDAQVYGDAWVYEDAQVSYGAKIHGDAQICGGALVFDGAQVHGGVKVNGDAKVHGDVEICGNMEICGDAFIQERVVKRLGRNRRGRMMLHQKFK